MGRSLRSLLRRLFHLSPQEKPTKDFEGERIEYHPRLRACMHPTIRKLEKPTKDRSLEPTLDKARRILAEIDAEIPIKSVEEHAREEWLPKSRARRRRIPRRRHRRPGSSITAEDIGRLMDGKGKHQHSTYRASVKARIQPEDD